MLVARLLAPDAGAARAQSPAETLRSVHEAARDSLQTEREAAGEALARLNVEAKEALAGWLRRGSGVSSETPPPREDSKVPAQVVDRTTGNQTKTQRADTPSSTPDPSRSETGREASSRKNSPEGAPSAPAVRTAKEGSVGPEASNTSTGSEGVGTGMKEPREAASAVPTTRRRAAVPYRPLLDRYARRRDVPRTLVYAIADAESFFDRDAVSSAGAIGLMQVHPPTGGRLAWETVYGAPQTPSREYLTKPENNVRLGTKLLELLLRKYFGGVKDEWSRQLLATASYNAGVSRVADGLTRDGSLEAAVKLANGLGPRRIYEQLRRTAPPETQTYVRRVFRRRKHYAPWRADGEVVYGVPEKTSSK